MSVYEEVNQQVLKNLERFGGMRTLKTYGVMDWAHFIVNQLAVIKRERQEKGEFGERIGDTRNALVKVAALAIVGVMALDERNQDRDDKQLHKDER